MKSGCWPTHIAAQQAGAFGIVLECIPAALAARITAELKIPTIGIGAGAGCDGQILVYHDLLGLTPGRVPRHVKPYAELHRTVLDAVTRYRDDVRQGTFPGPEQTFGRVREANQSGKMVRCARDQYFGDVCPGENWSRNAPFRGASVLHPPYGSHLHQPPALPQIPLRRQQEHDGEEQRPLVPQGLLRFLLHVQVVGLLDQLGQPLGSRSGSMTSPPEDLATPFMASRSAEALSNSRSCCKTMNRVRAVPSSSPCRVAVTSIV